MLDARRHHVEFSSLVFAINLSHKLDKVRKQVQFEPGDIKEGSPSGGFSKVQLKLNCESKCSTLTFQDGE